MKKRAVGVKVYDVGTFVRKTESGLVDHDHAFEIALSLAEALGKHPGSNALLDLRATELPEGFGIHDIFEILDEVKPLKPLFHSKVASLIPDTRERLESATLLKALLELNGFDYEVFVDFEKALDWLSTITSA